MLKHNLGQMKKYIYIHFKKHTPKAFRHKNVIAESRQKERKKRERKRSFPVRMCPLEMSGATPMKTHQHGCLKMIRMRTKLIDLLTEKGERPGGLSPRYRTTGNSRMLRVGEMVFPGKSTPVII